LVVIRSDKKIFIRSFGEEWTDKLKTYSRIIGFSYEDNQEEIKLEFNPDRPDIYSTLSLIHSIRTYFGSPSKRGEMSVAKRRINNLKPRCRPYIIALEVNLGKTNSRVAKDSLEYFDRISENVGKKRKLFASGIHDLNKVIGDLTYGEISVEEEFETFDDKRSTIFDLINEHPKGREYGSLVSDSLKDGKICALKDSNRIISIPPLFNSKSSRVENDTLSVLVDITASTKEGLILGARLGAGYFTKLGLNVQFLNSECSEEILSSLKSDMYQMDSEVIKEISGVSASIPKIATYLKKMGYGIDKKNIKVPLERIDVMGYEDIVEDFIKAYGINQIEPRELTSNFTGKLDELNMFTSKVRQVAIDYGFLEIINFVLRKEEGDDKLEILNAKSEEFSKLRKNLIGGILEFFQRNRQYGFPQKVFEVGEVFIEGTQDRTLAVSICGRHSNYSDIKGYLDGIIQAFGISNIQMHEGNMGEFVYGRHGIVEIEGDNVGFIGEISPEIIQKYSFNFPVTYFEISLTKLYEKLKKKHIR
jgi:phenylalanyl-tRNA synthetase beta chain